MKGRGRGTREGALAGLAFVLLTVIVYFPMSLSPARLSLAHRTASNHTMLMYHFNEYFSAGEYPPLTHIDIWAYPEGGIVRPIAVPALVPGFVLSRMVAPRTAFNVLFMANIILSAFTFYLVGRRAGFTATASTAAGIIAVFQPCLQSFILRGQIENTMLWTVGLAVLAGFSFLSREKPRWRHLAALCLLPLLILFSTPYYAIFFVVLSPFMLLFAMGRFRLGWRDRSLRLYVVSLLAAFALLLALVGFYRPDIGHDMSAVNISPGSFSLGLAGAAQAESVTDYVNPAGVLKREKPYLGLAFLTALLLASIYRIGRKVDRRQMGVLVTGAALFAMLSMGRKYGVPDASWQEGTRLPAALIDLVWPTFLYVIHLFRALPFMAICGGLVVAGAIDRLGPRKALAATAAVAALMAADGLVTSPLSQRTKPPYRFDSRIDIDPLIFAMPKEGDRPRPVLDLPPPHLESTGFWGAYAYYQTEHRQKLAWCDITPQPQPAFMARATDFFESPLSYLEDRSLALEFGEDTAEAGIGFIVLHRKFLDRSRADRLAMILDSLFSPVGRNEDTIVWSTVP